MQSNEEAFQAFFLQNPRPMAVCDPREEICLLVNEALAALHERPMDETAALRPYLLAGRVRTHSGRWLWVEAEAREIVYEGRPARLLAYEDVTERRATEEAARSYRGIFENALDGIFQTTPDGSYLRTNAALARIYGYQSPEDLIQSLSDVARQLYVEPGRRDEFIRLMAERDAVSGFEAQIYRKDGGTTWIVEHARAVRDEAGRLLYYEGTVQDIAERKALEAER